MMEREGDSIRKTRKKGTVVHLFTCLLIETMSVKEKNKKDGGHRG